MQYLARIVSIPLVWYIHTHEWWMMTCSKFMHKTRNGNETSKCIYIFVLSNACNKVKKNEKNNRACVCVINLANAWWIKWIRCGHKSTLSTSGVLFVILVSEFLLMDARDRLCVSSLLLFFWINFFFHMCLFCDCSLAGNSEIFFFYYGVFFSRLWALFILSHYCVMTIVISFRLA